MLLHKIKEYSSKPKKLELNQLMIKESMMKENQIKHNT
jgi:hypothetical protein